LNNSSTISDEHLQRFFPLVWSIARKYAVFRYEPYREDSDVYSEGLIGLLKAVETYDSSRTASLETWITSCVKWQIRDYLKLRKSRLLTQSEFIDETPAKEHETAAFDDIAKLRDSVELFTDPKLRRIFELRIDGKTLQEIADELKCSKQAIDGLFQRRILPVLKERFLCSSDGV
jgi:RNA polymerase sigma factor (sigma-70 family)